MGILLAGGSSYAQFITVSVVFILVLIVTLYVTRWMGNFQKKTNPNLNVEVIECTQIANNKFIEIVRVGETYKVLAICKETVTDLGVIGKDEIKTAVKNDNQIDFKQVFDKFKSKIK